MKKYRVVLGGILYFAVSASSMAVEQSVTEIISCSLPGGDGRVVLFSINNETKEINYVFRKAGKIELSVHFNKKNKLKRLVDNKMGVTYYGFNRGEYSYVIDIINGHEKEEYTMSFDVKRNNKLIQSNDCLPNSFRNDGVESNFIVDIPYVESNEFVFP